MSNDTKADNSPIICRYLYYRERLSSGTVQWVKLPVVPIDLVSPAAHYITLALVDSGSDRTFLQKQDSEVLQLKLVKEKDGSSRSATAVGAGAAFTCDIMVVPELSLMQKSRPFCTFRSLQVWVPREYDKIPISILGRDSVFRRFDITFQEGRKQLAFRRP